VKENKIDLDFPYLDYPKIANDPRRANLCGADLSVAPLAGANLAGANLAGAELYAAHLEGANLKAAQLEGAHLYAAHLAGANLEGANLYAAHLNFAHLNAANLNFAYLNFAHLEGANLDAAHLSEAYLSEAHLNAAHLEGADLDFTHLEGADLNDAHLESADLRNVDLAKTYLDFDSDKLPKISPGIASAHNLQLVTFHDEPAALVKLRKEFRDLGLRTQENQLTYAIRRTELYRKKTDLYGKPTKEFLHTRSERVFNTVAFDWTCQYGMSPSRPLLIVAVIALGLSVVYIFAQLTPGPNGGIWAVWDEHRIKQAEGSKEPQQLKHGFPGARSYCSVLLLAFFFSLLSATRIGWRELNVGTWITRIQPREYSLRATGWVRVVSGIQSLISVYLVALTILTYFSTPFEY
jgi:hypothetical protein